MATNSLLAEDRAPSVSLAESNIAWWKGGRRGEERKGEEEGGRRGEEGRGGGRRGRRGAEHEWREETSCTQHTIPITPAERLAPFPSSLRMRQGAGLQGCGPGRS